MEIVDCSVREFYINVKILHSAIPHENKQERTKILHKNTSSVFKVKLAQTQVQLGKSHTVVRLITAARLVTGYKSAGFIQFWSLFKLSINNRLLLLSAISIDGFNECNLTILSFTDGLRYFYRLFTFSIRLLSIEKKEKKEKTRQTHQPPKSKEETCGWHKEGAMHRCRL